MQNISSSASAEHADVPAARDGPGPGCLAGMLEGLMVTVQHEDDGRKQLVHPLQAEEEVRRKRIMFNLWSVSL